MDGILNINKHSGVTSFYAIALIRRLSGERRVGHAGTLDPLASGIQVIGVGRGTRALEFMSGTKVYRASLTLGATTDTYDAEGKVTSVCDPSGVTLEQITTALEKFEGEIQQVPPAYSAIKQGGRRLYELARAGTAVIAPARPVVIHRIEVTCWDSPTLDIEVECGRGTYIRSIAHDLGQDLGCGAYLKALQRVKDGPFYIDKAIPLAELPERVERSGWQDTLMPIDSVIGALPSVVIEDKYVGMAVNGVPLPVELVPLNAEPSDGQLFRTYSSGGVFLAVTEYSSSELALKPRKVFASSA
ncbi:MAG: tRNA pseudouridine(55) synthase TruB [Dehalococcoidia bacterium]|nr:tRNA pseudouridine(55) synthase TruB [Dehalococcoidia bacterium]